MFVFFIVVAVSSFDLGDKQKRWVVIGICLNRLLLPVLRDFTGQEILKHYTSLKSSRKIDAQVVSSHLTHDRSFKLNYSSINNNWVKFRRKELLYDYKVATDVDLAKLYLEPHMAKFTGETMNYAAWEHVPYEKERVAHWKFRYQDIKNLCCGPSVEFFQP